MNVYVGIQTKYENKMGKNNETTKSKRKMFIV